ncbi:hypothetical protein AB836_00730 [Rickettsiales bacterium (ex Bugula neritina AB1)]|nr:hypothetical protein AB836_00730 [Rickettsiales bacterium (ex Bugula neritina AB1)]
MEKIYHLYDINIINMSSNYLNEWLQEMKKRMDILEGFHNILEKLVYIGDEINYPPTNIEKINDEQVEIQMALAGFEKQQIDIEFTGLELIININKKNDESNKIYLKKGIAFRSAKRNFFLGEGAKILDAVYTNGLLKISVYIPSINKNIQKIFIRSGDENERF